MPVFDGMCAADDRIFLSCHDGSVRCAKTVDWPQSTQRTEGTSEVLEVGNDIVAKNR